MDLDQDDQEEALETRSERFNREQLTIWRKEKRAEERERKKMEQKKAREAAEKAELRAEKKRKREEKYSVILTRT